VIFFMPLESETMIDEDDIMPEIDAGDYDD
jgi:hypothetical protein